MSDTSTTTTLVVAEDTAGRASPTFRSTSSHHPIPAQVPRHIIPLVLPGCLDCVVRYSRVEIHSSARRHGVNDLDIQHAVEHSLAIEDIGEDPDRWLVIGPDRAGNLLELVVLVDQRGEIVIHAMALRPKYRKLLEP